MGQVDTKRENNELTNSKESGGFVSVKDLEKVIAEEKSEKPMIGEDAVDSEEKEELEEMYPDIDEWETIYIPKDKEINEDFDQKRAILYKQEDTRGKLAILYTIFTFLLFLIGIAVAVIDGLNRDVDIVQNLKDLLTILSGIFLGTLGFVLGYYFRRGEEK